MKPTCKLCEARHWLDEGHAPTAALDKVRELGASVLRNAKRNNVTEPNNVTPVTKPAVHIKSAEPTDGGAQPLVHPGRPKKHASNAERRRAYRERSRE